MTLIILLLEDLYDKVAISGLNRVVDPGKWRLTLPLPLSGGEQLALTTR
jgi:hypothetical protein